jgi:cytochrome c553
MEAGALVMRLMALAAVALAAFPGAAQGPAGKELKGELKTAMETRGDPARGEVLYEPCTGCHRADASGRTSGAYPRLAGQHASVLIKQIVDIRSGQRSNPKMANFVDEHVLNPYEIADLGAYLSGLPITDANARGPGRFLAQGKALYGEHCAACHGDAGEGNAAKFYPMVAAQHYKYLLRQLKQIRSRERHNANPEMVKVIQPLGDRDLEALADHMAQLPPPKQKAPPR